MANNSTKVGVVKIKISSLGMNSDIHASANYRANMVSAFAKKAVDAC